MAKVLADQRFTYKFGHAVAMLFICFIMFMGLLSMMRSDSQTLDGEIAKIQAQIDALDKESRELERACASMMSPKAVHAYAARELGMTQVHLAGTLHLNGSARSDTATASLAGAARY